MYSLKTVAESDDEAKRLRDALYTCTERLGLPAPVSGNLTTVAQELLLVTQKARRLPECVNLLCFLFPPDVVRALQLQFRGGEPASPRSPATEKGQLHW